MIYKITLVFKDEKSIAVDLEESTLDKFMTCLHECKPFWSPDKDAGFWVNPSEVRYALCKKEAPPAEPKKQETPKEN